MWREPGRWTGSRLCSGVCVKLSPATQPTALIARLASSLFGAAEPVDAAAGRTNGNASVGVIIMLLTRGHVTSKISQNQSSHCFLQLIFKLPSTQCSEDCSTFQDDSWTSLNGLPTFIVLHSSLSSHFLSFRQSLM